MIFYLVVPCSQPEICFSCSTRNQVSQNTLNIIDHREGIMEISYHDSVDLQIESENGILTVPPGSISLCMPNCRYTISPVVESTDQTTFTISTVAAKFRSMDYTCFDEKDYDKIHEIMEKYPEDLILPQTLYFDADNTLDSYETMKDIHSKIMLLISTYRDKGAKGKYSCISQWYDICAEIDGCFRSHVSLILQKSRPILSSAHYYVYKAQKYIESHITELINPIDVSKNIGLKHPYFIRIFKQEKNLSLHEYIYRLKIQHFCTVIEQSPTKSFKQLAAECGFTDLRHTQRLFKKYVGMTMSDYRRLGNGLTLYHENPWQRENNSEDLFKNTEK